MIVLLVLLAVGGGAVLLLSGDDDESGGGGEASADTPEGAVQVFFDALASGDCEALSGLVVQSESSQEMLEACQSGGEGLGGVELNDAELVSQDGTTAVVRVTYTYQSFSASGGPDQEPTTSVEDVTDTIDAALVQEGGTWRLDVTSFESDSSD